MDAEYIWVLDPIDGTKSFITGKPLFGTLIALLHKGRPVLGVIDQCILRERWVGANGCTLLNGQPVRSLGQASLADAMVYATTPHMFAAGFEQESFTRLGSRVKRVLYGCDCYAYALLASGFVDLVVEADLGVYDYCALVPVVTYAGGKMSDWNGEPLALPSADKHKGRVVAAASEELWRATVEVLNEPRAASSEGDIWGDHMEDTPADAAESVDEELVRKLGGREATKKLLEQVAATGGLLPLAKRLRRAKA